jgi:hypothetical protein
MKSISDLRRRIARLLMLDVASSLSIPGHSGMTSVGSRSLAPRATILPMVVERFCCMVLSCGTGGAFSGVGTRLDSLPRDLGRRMVDARRSLLGLEKLAEPSIGAVMGVMGAGVMGVVGPPGALLLMRESYGFFAGEMAILARESFIEIDRNRRCAAGFLMMGEAALLLAFS